MIRVPQMMRRWMGWLGMGLGLTVAVGSTEQPTDAHFLPLDAVMPGMVGEVWTVFSGTQPEPFTVKVTGVIHNALGPGKSMILCELTDPRVQHMGAVAGMSGSPLYVNGRFAGALSYQVQRFETVRFAGFTPAEDLLEVRRIALADESASGSELPAALPLTTDADSAGITPLSPVFSFGGVSPAVAGWATAELRKLGVGAAALGGAHDPALSVQTASELTAGQAVGAALAVGDITLAGTGTVSRVDGNRVLAFGHPLLGLGEVEMPMTSAEIVTILPSNLSSVKIANTGGIIGTVRQDRLSAIYGEIGPAPAMVPVTVRTPQRTLNFSTVRHPRITPMITAIGLSQAVMGSNDAGLSEGFRVKTTVEFTDGERLEMAQLYGGAKAFQNGLNGLVTDLSTWLQNPVEEAFPARVAFDVVPLATNPTTSLDNLRLSHRTVTAGDTLAVTVSLRDFQSQPLAERVKIPIPAEWTDRKLEVIVTNGPNLDLITGGQRSYPVSQIRDFTAYLNVLRAQRAPDGIFVAVVTSTPVFLDQTEMTAELPASLSRIARTADEARFTERTAREVLWETHLLPNRLVPGSIGQRFRVRP